MTALSGTTNHTNDFQLGGLRIMPIAGRGTDVHCCPSRFCHGVGGNIGGFGDHCDYLKTGRYFLGVCVGIVSVYILRSLGL